MRLYLLILSYLIFAVAKAQSPHAFNLGELYNFNIKTIYDLHQDSANLLWIGTDQGLFKFDGTDFQRYKVEKYQSEFSSIKQDKTGRIWFQNFTGQVFYIQNDSIRLFIDYNEQSTDGLITYDPSLFPDIYITSDKTIQKIALTETGSKPILPLSNTIVQLPDSLEQNFIYNLLIKDTALYFSVSTKLFRQDKKGLNFISEFNQPLKKRIHQFQNKDNIYSLGLSHNNDLIIKQLNKVNITDKVITGLPEIIPQSIYYDESNGYFWIGSYAGLFCFTENFELINDKPFLQDYSISSILKDKEGNYIIGTLQNGILVMPSVEILVYNEENSALQSNILLDIQKINDNKLLLLDDKNTLYLFSTQERAITKKIKLDERITKLHYSENEQIVYLFPSRKCLKLASFNIAPSSLFNIKNISEIDDTLHLISKIEGAEIITQGGTNKLKNLFPNENFTHTPASEQGYESLLLRQKRSLANSPNTVNSFYMAYSDGLFYYKNGHPSRIEYKGNNLIVSHFIKKENKLLAITNEGRLFQLYDEQVEFIKEFEISILNVKIQDEDLLIASDHGIIRYNLITQAEDKINFMDGMPTDIVNNIAVAGDRIFAATTEGLVLIPKSYNYKNLHAPSVVIKNIWVNEALREIEQMTDLKSSENSIRIELNTYAIRARKTHQIAYRFANIDTSWMYSTSNTLTYNSLSPGSYQLEIKGINEDKVASEKATFLPIEILKPFYQQWWFFLLITLLTIFIISYVYFVRFRNFQIQSQLKESLAESKQKLAESSLASIRAQMNPHFLFNAINSVQMLISEGDNEQSQKYLNKLASLVRSSLTNSEKNFISAGVEIELIKSYLELEKLRFEEDFEYELVSAERLEGIQIPSMIIQPFVENAVKHGLMHRKGQKRLKITFIKSAYLKCVIEDNGIGREASKALNAKRGLNHRSFSTHSIEKRFSILKEYYRLDLGFYYEDLIDKNVSLGTRVILNIPFIKERESETINRG